MRALAKVLMGITLVVLVFTTYLLYGSHLKVTLESVSIQPAGERMDAFEGVKAAVKSGEFAPYQYRNDLPGDAADYSFVTITLRVTNYGILPAEWVEIKVSPQAGDLLQVPVDPLDLPGLQSAYLSTALLSESANISENHAVWLEYYVFGRKLHAEMVKPS